MVKLYLGLKTDGIKSQTFLDYLTLVMSFLTRTRPMMLRFICRIYKKTLKPYDKKFMENLWAKTSTVDYDQKVENEIKAWMKSNGYEVKKITN